MKKLLMILIVLGSFLSLASIAQADSSFSIGFGERWGHHRFHDDRARFYFSYYEPYYPYYPYRAYNYPYYPYYPDAYQTTVINTYETPPTQTVVYNNQNSREKFGIADIIALSKAGVSDDAIIDKIAKTGSVYLLSVEEVETMRKEGVSSRVINFMLNTKR